MKTKENIIAVGLIFFALFLHLYRLGSVPRGLYVDEMGMAYDAWSIGTYGVDRYLKSLPLYLTNFGGGQSILYCYLDIFFVKLWGINAVTIRMPAVIFSMITGVCGYQIIRRQWSQNAGLLYLSLFCLLPYFTMSGRIGLDCNLMLGMIVLFFVLLQQAIITDRNRWYGAAGVAAGVTFYSYALSYLVLPIFLISLCGYLFYTKKINLRKATLLLLPAVGLALPLLVIQIINIFNLHEIQILGFTYTKLPDYRGSEINVASIKDNLCYLHDSLFGTDVTDFGNFEPYSNFYSISVPFLAVGVVAALTECVDSIRSKRFHMSVPIVCFAVLQLIFSCFLTGVTTYRINAVFYPLAYFLVLGIKCIWQTRQKWTKPLLSVAAVSYLCLFISFARYYFFLYPQEVYPQKLFGAKMDQVLEYLQRQPESIQGRITYVGGVNEAYIYYLGSTLQPPHEYDISSHGNIGNEKFQFYMPDTLSADANYIVYAARTDDVALLETAGYTCTQLGEYVLGVYEWENYQAVPDAEGVIENVWDVRREEGENVLLAGWCVDGLNKAAWDCIFLYVDGIPYTATRYDRKDVVTATGCDEYLESGLSFEVPADLFNQADEMELYCISHDDRVYYTKKVEF